MERLLILVISCSIGLAYCGTGTDTSISQFGITWTFDKENKCGQFVNGDYWVLDEGDGVNIVDIEPSTDPDASRHMHGSMINPSTATQGYDSFQYYDESLNVALGVSEENPLVLTGDMSLVSTISNENPGTSQHTSYVMNASILTCVSNIPTELSFRPGYSHIDKRIFNLNDLDMVLPSLTIPDGVTSDINSITEKLQMVWLAHNGGWTGRYMRPSGSGLGNYYYSQDFSVAALMLLMDYPESEKNNLLINYMQLGIDLYSYLESGANGWPPDGGHSSARKLPILFTGILLDYEPMKELGNVSGSHLYSDEHGPGNAPEDYIYFGEDGQTFHVAQSDIDITNSNAWNPDTRNEDYSPYSQEMLGMPEWGIRYSTDQTRSDSSWSATYRTIGTGGRAWVGSTMAARIIGAKQLWNYNALFDYVDRFAAIEQGQPDPFGYTVSNEGTGAWPGGLIGAMYNEYREDFGCMGTGHDASGYLQYVCDGESVDCALLTSCDDYPNQAAEDDDPCDCPKECIPVEVNEIFMVIESWKDGDKSLYDLMRSVKRWKKGC